MTEAVTIALIAAIGSMLTTLISGAALILANRSLSQSKATHEAVNGAMHELVAAKVGQAHAEGVTSGEQAQRDRSAEAQP